VDGQLSFSAQPEIELYLKNGEHAHALSPVHSDPVGPAHHRQRNS
jgi:hypothetical protein